MTTSRRDFIGSGVNNIASIVTLGAGLSAVNVLADDVMQSDEAGAATNMPLPSAEVLMLNRTSFGIRQQDLDLIEEQGIEAYLEQQMDWQSIDDSSVESYLQEYTPSIYFSQGELLELEKNQVVGQLKSATVFRSLYSERQLYEVMVEFWSNHFSIYHQDGPVALLKTADDRDVIRPHALGKFKDLLRASSKSPAMLVYLDNHTNVQGTPNENYARELMELHTLGIEGGYTEEDVQELSRCLTGWGVARRGIGERGHFKFYPQFHDQGAKSLLGISIPENGGIADGETVVDLLAAHPSTANFIAQKLVRRFVSDNPPEALVTAVADTFLDTDGDIKAMLWTIFLSDEFALSADEKLKRPLEYMSSMLRTLDATLGENAQRILRDYLLSLGQMPFNWVPPNGYPDVAAYWVSTNGMLNRWNFSLALAASELRGIKFDYFPLVGKIWRPSNIVDALAKNILRRQLLDDDREMFIDYLTAGGFAKHFLSFEQMKERVPGLIGLLLSSDYFQYR